MMIRKFFLRSKAALIPTFANRNAEPQRVANDAALDEETARLHISDALRFMHRQIVFTAAQLTQIGRAHV